MTTPRALSAALVVVSLLAGSPALAQDACPDTLAWTRTLAIKLGQSRTQAEIEAAQAQTRMQRLEADVQRLTEELRKAKEAMK